MNAVYKLENPEEQNVLGNEVDVEYPAAADAVHNWPPLSHSHWILSLPRSSSTIIRMARTALMTMMKGHRNLQTLVQMYDRLESANMLMMATAATPKPIPP